MSEVGMEYSLKGILRELVSYKSGLLGIILIILLVGLSVYTVITLPADEAIRLWRGEGGVWLGNPRNAAPEWIEIFIGKKLSRTIKVDSREKRFGVIKAVTPVVGTNFKKIHIELTFNYEYDDFPSELNLFFNAKFDPKGNRPLLKIYWKRPDGTEIKLIDYTLRSEDDRFYLSINEQVFNTLSSYVIEKTGIEPGETVTTVELLFGKYNKGLATGDVEVEKGTYKLIIDAMVFDQKDNIDVKMIVYGHVYGIAGTDHLRRPLEIALLWGTPVALAFGLTASLVTSILQLIIATISGWYGGIVDSIIQRITEIYMILPFLPFLIMISAFYHIDIWVLLVVVIVLSIFGGGVKSTRALVMQIKEYPYVEAAKAYGASNARIIFLYLIPKILPPLVPGLISAVPGYVFLEAALSFLGLGDPYLPTWGKMINDAYNNGALYKGYFYWVLEPSFLLILTALAFAFLGFALDKIVNPRLREM